MISPGGVPCCRVAKAQVALAIRPLTGYCSHVRRTRIWCAKNLLLPEIIMTLRQTLLTLALLILPVLVNASEATHTMSSILAAMQHFPTDSDKTELAAIVASEATSQDEKTRAQIISRIAHHANADDKAALLQMTEKPEATSDVRTIAKAILNMNHTVQAEDMVELSRIMGS